MTRRRRRVEEEENEEKLLRSLTVELFHLRLFDYPVHGEVTWQRDAQSCNKRPG
jgi:hypothetical protein